ncbi:MAG TPA: N-6 DNA methylase [Candidatus Saccharibacteria bacterium]|nr:N-6 DNA methylase [Candidatus Saccharibacteria bacterium]HRQ06825.1 N-6 DNA methylase [Candidatus Saccharibacteria bacterium]
MASLFGKNKLREVASKLQTSDIEKFIEIIETWHNDYHKGSLRTDKETSREQAYNQDFFVRILGYQEKPASPFSLEPKATTEKGQLPDVVLSYTDKANGVENIAAVVELKGAAIPLDRPQRREGNMSPVQQGFKYKTQYRNCPFVIVSNFYEFRLYHDNQLDYELWTLDDLVNPEDDYLLFKTWYTLLRKDHFVSKSGQSKTEQLLSDIRVEQENIGKKFYKVYKEARIELIRDIYRRNSSVRSNVDIGIQKAQKIIDRIVFAAFAEDRGLLPDNTLHRVIASADNSVFGGSLWNALKGFFEAIDKGSPKLEIPDGYNGGLFKVDPQLDALEIDDAPLRKVVGLGTYNFAEDLSVNILGHIFEQSISDIEEIKNKVNESQDLEMLSQSRRKKDGIFYTPDYIVRYIVDNSLGTYLREHEEKFKEEFGLKGDILDKTYEKREIQAYTKYQDFLQNVKVVDPACGSGAFLVYVFDYLLAENQRVGDILGMSLFSTDTYVRDILRNNIYGVDLNKESVEITKLSLWLKTAQKGKKLTALDENIKCGNSLLVDWEEKFPDVFKDGGFDVVVMNPPYVKEAAGKQIFADLHDNPLYQGKMDLWYLFGGLALDITKPDVGIVGLIAPSNWTTNDGATKFRNKIVSEARLDKFIDFGNYKVFDQAGIQTMVAVLRRTSRPPKYKVVYSKVLDHTINLDGVRDFLNKIEDIRFAYFKSDFDRSRLKDSIFTFTDTSDEALLSKIERYGKLHLEKREVFSGIDIGQDYLNKKSQARLGEPFKVGDGVFNLSKKEYEQLNPTDVEREIIKPFYTTRQVNRYLANPDNESWVIYTTSQFKDPSKIRGYPNVQRHLDKFQPIITSANKPYGLHRSRDEEIFLGEKILSIRKCARPSFSYVDYDTYVNRTYNIIKTDRVDLRYLTAILNSQLVAYWLLKKGKMQGEQYQVDVNPICSIPIAVTEDQSQLSGSVARMGSLTLNLSNASTRFRQLLKIEFGLDNLSNKLNRWWTLSLTDFTKYLNVKLSLQQKDELFQLFEKYKGECVELDAQIQKTDHEIDQLVYKLYSLTYDDIAVVENNTV